MRTKTKTSLAIVLSIRDEEVYANYGVRDETALHSAIGAVLQTSFRELAYSDAYKRSAILLGWATMRSAVREAVTNRVLRQLCSGAGDLLFGHLLDPFGFKNASKVTFNPQPAILSWRWDLNPQPTVYKTVALPIAPLQHTGQPAYAMRNRADRFR